MMGFKTHFAHGTLQIGPREVSHHSNDAVDINENEAHSPCKNLEGRPINLDFSRLQSLRNQISMRSLVPRERNKMATRRSK